MNTRDVASIGIAVIACSVALVSSASAQIGGTDGRGITVTGEAEVQVSPDQVILTLGVETAAVKLESAKLENDARVKRVIDRMKTYVTDARRIQTEHLSVEPTYRNRFEADEILRYIVRQTIAVDLRKIDAFEGALSDALAAGANYVHGVQFRTTELRAHRDRARALAVQAAKEKAALLAQALGRSLGAANAVREDHVGWWSWYGSWWGGGRYGAMSQNVVQTGPASASADSITAPGQISVTARITVTFEMK